MLKKQSNVCTISILFLHLRVIKSTAPSDIQLVAFSTSMLLFDHHALTFVLLYYALWSYCFVYQLSLYQSWWIDGFRIRNLKKSIIFPRFMFETNDHSINFWWFIFHFRDFIYIGDQASRLLDHWNTRHVLSVLFIYERLLGIVTSFPRLCIFDSFHSALRSSMWMKEWETIPKYTQQEQSNWYKVVVRKLSDSHEMALY